MDVLTFDATEQEIRNIKKKTQLVAVYVMGIWTGVRIRGDPAVRLYLTERLESIVIRLK